MSQTFLSKQQRPDDELIPSTYDKYINRIFDTYCPIHLFGTGSDGNAVYIKPLRMLIDLGLKSFKPYDAYDPQFFSQVDFIVITHHHSDHLNPSHLFRILKEYPHIKVFITQFLYKYVTSDKYKPKKTKSQRTKTVIDPFTNEKSEIEYEHITINYPFMDKFKNNQSRFYEAKEQWLTTHDGNSFLFSPRTVKHGDIVNIAIQLYDPASDLKLLYSSDLDDLGTGRAFWSCFGEQENVEGLHQTAKYNVILLEANYNEEKLQVKVNEFIEKTNADIMLTEEEKAKAIHNYKVRADGNRRHIEEKETFKYVLEHLEDDGIFIPLHASASFGSLFQG